MLGPSCQSVILTAEVVLIENEAQIKQTKTLVWPQQTSKDPLLSENISLSTLFSPSRPREENIACVVAPSSGCNGKQPDLIACLDELDIKKNKIIHSLHCTCAGNLRRDLSTSPRRPRVDKKKVL